MAKSKKFDLENPAPVADDEDEETLAAIDEDEGIRDAEAGRTVPAEEVRRLLSNLASTLPDSLQHLSPANPLIRRDQRRTLRHGRGRDQPVRRVFRKAGR